MCMIDTLVLAKVLLNNNKMRGFIHKFKLYKGVIKYILSEWIFLIF